MNLNKKILLTLLISMLTAGCNRPVATQPVDLFATLQASTPSGGPAPQVTQPVETPDFNFPSVPSPTAASTSPCSPQDSIPCPSGADQLQGLIVFTCQIFKVQYADQICIMN